MESGSAAALCLEMTELGSVELVAAVDVDALCGADATSLAGRLAPVVRRLSALQNACLSRAVATNQHNAHGSKSGSAFVGDLLGISESQAREDLAAQKELRENPDVEDKVRDGSLSAEKAKVITRSARGDQKTAQRLLKDAETSSVEDLKRKASKASPGESAGQKRERLRKSQYVSIERDSNNMLLGRFKLLPDVAAPWLSRWSKLERQARLENEKAGCPLPPAAAAAEAFAVMLGESGGSTTSVVNYHLKLEDWKEQWPSTGEYCEIGGIGPVPVSVLDNIAPASVLRLLVTEQNKLVWFSETNLNKALPDYIKRAVKAAAFDTCENDGCVGVAKQVDHVTARTNGGRHRFGNLQALCEQCHHAKTKKDAPWTTGGIYGKKREEREKRRQRRQRRVEEPDDDVGYGTLFDTG